MAPWSAVWGAWPPAPSAGVAPRRRRDTASSSLLSSDAWRGSSASSREPPPPRRPLPYHALLPPLRLPPPPPPPPPAPAPPAAAAAAWPPWNLPPERFSLPPIELPRLAEPEDVEVSPDAGEPAPEPRWGAGPPRSCCASSGRLSRRATPRRPRRAPPGVHKPRRRARASALRRTLTHLMQRTIRGCLFASRGESASSCCVRAALSTLRAAWPTPPPAPAAHACRPLSCGSDCSRVASRTALASTATASCGSRPASRAAIASTSPRAAIASTSPRAAAAMPPASPAPPLLRRRYSVPEIIMRKYRLAQDNTEAEGRGAATSPSLSPGAGACACAGCGAGARGDRELMRKSALLRRLWGPPPPARALAGSSCELRRAPASPATPASPAAPPRARLSPACSDCALAARRARSPASPASPARGERDVFARYSDLAGAAERSSGALSVADETDTITASPPTALEARAPRRPPPFDADDGPERHASLPFEALGVRSPAYETLEIVVSETVEAAPRPAARARPADIDEYVSNILVESLQSLSQQLDGMQAAVGGAGLVVEKEIKVRLQHAAVNTIVHLSPTSNHQIIFGNEELCRADDAGPPSARAAPDPGGSDPPDGVNRAVLQQIRKLFRDEPLRAGSTAVVGRVEPDADSFPARPSSPDPPPVVGVGAGNYWARAEPALVPRPTALPHSVSMEVNTSSSDAEPSACTSLVDSLDDPASPRAPPAPPAPAPRRLARSALDVLALLPAAPGSPPPAPTPAPEAFFVRIADGACERERRDDVVAASMPDTIRERLLRRQRKREQRMENARRKRMRARLRGADRDARAAVSALVDELVAKIVRDEYDCMRVQRRGRADPAPPARRADPPPRAAPDAVCAPRARPAPPPVAEPRRIYQKSEIRDGDRCIEILEILEYADESQNSPDTTNSDERPGGPRSRRSKIPVPVAPDRPQRPLAPRSLTTDELPPPSPPTASPPPARRASLPAPASPSARAASLRLRRVFDAIPEERAPPPATRSAATSPPAPQRASRSTMTSPRAPPPPRPAAGIALACAPCR